MNDGVYIFTYIDSANSHSGNIKAVIIYRGKILLSQAIVFLKLPRKRLSKRLFELYFGIPEYNSILYHHILPQQLKLMQTTAQKIYKVQVRWEMGLIY